MFLSGMILSVDIIAQSDVLNWVSRLIPFRYSTGNMVIASTPLPQLGDMFQQLDDSQMKLIFNGWDKHAHTVVFGYGQHVTGTTTGMSKQIVVHDMDELGDARNLLKGQFNAGLKDDVLFRLTFGRVLESGVTKSDQNIFNWIDGWAVRRIPDVGGVKKFIIDYFNQFGTSGAGGGAGADKLMPLFVEIQKGQFGWLDIFLKQTNTLYYQADRILNFAVPVVASGLSIWYVATNFNWSAR